MPANYTQKNGLSSSGKQQFKPDSSHYLYNIDTFWYNIDADNYEQIMSDGLRDKLIDGRTYTLDNGDSQTIEINLSTYENPLLFEIMAGQPPLYQYSIRNEDIAIYFSKVARVDNMPIKVQINQFILWEKGLSGAYSESLQLLIALGFKIGQAKLNRVDFAVHSDQFNWNFSDFKSFVYPRNIADDNKPTWWKLCPETGEFESVYYGSRKYCQLRIYNKSKEIKVRGKHHFTEMYERIGINAENVWNVEIEVRRDFIKECKDIFDNRMFDDLDKVINNNLLSELWSYLMTMYSHNSAHWTQLSKGAKGKFEKIEHTVTRVKDIDWSTDREVAQIYGRLQKFLIATEHDTIDMAVKSFLEKAFEYEKKKERVFKKEVNDKKKMYHDENINSFANVNKINDLPEWVKKMLEKHNKKLEKGIIKSAAEKKAERLNNPKNIIQ